jgi:hypothetical protein
MSVFTTPEPITATLTVGGARVRIAASERPDTVVRVEPVDSTSKSDVKVAERTEVGFADGELSVKTVKSGDKNGSVVITIELPAGSGLALNTAWTDVRAEGPLGDCTLNVASGRVELDRVAALRGNLAGGAVGIGHVAGIVDLDGGTAGLRLGEVDGAVRYQGASGKVWIGTARSGVVLGGSSGAFEIDRAEGDVIARASNCPIRIGRLVRGHAELVNAAGGIEIGIDPGTAAVVDADSTKGAVRDSLSVRDGLAGFDEKVTVHARTRRDDIVIHPAAG